MEQPWTFHHVTEKKEKVGMSPKRNVHAGLHPNQTSKKLVLCITTNAMCF